MIFVLVKVINSINDSIKAKISNESEEKVIKVKVCPYCKEEIANEATRCPHCTSILE